MVSNQGVGNNRFQLVAPHRHFRQRRFPAFPLVFCPPLTTTLLRQGRFRLQLFVSPCPLQGETKCLETQDVDGQPWFYYVSVASPQNVFNTNTESVFVSSPQRMTSIHTAYKSLACIQAPKGSPKISVEASSEPVCVRNQKQSLSTYHCLQIHHAVMHWPAS